MDGQDYYLSNHSLIENHHRELQKISEDAHLAQSARQTSPGWLDRLLDRSGDLLISLGQRLKDHRSEPDLYEVCA
jgi:hypothetical protein